MLSSSEVSHSEDTLGKQECEAQRAAKAERRRTIRLRKTRRKLLDNKFHNKQKDRHAIDFEELFKFFPEDLPVSYMLDLLPDKQRKEGCDTGMEEDYLVECTSQPCKSPSDLTIVDGRDSVHSHWHGWHGI